MSIAANTSESVQTSAHVMGLIASLAHAEAALQRAVGPDIGRVIDENGGVHLLRKAQNALRVSEAGLVQAQRVAQMGSWELELLEGHAIGAVTWSDEMYRLLGYEPGAVPPTAECFLAHVPEPERARILAAIKECVQGDGTYLVQHHLRSDDGRERVVLERGVVVNDDAGRPVRLCGTCQDVTDKEKAHRALAASVDRNRQLLDAIQAGVVVHRDDGSIETFNATACRLLGMNPATLPGTPATKAAWNFLRADGARLPESEFPANLARTTGKPVRNKIVGIPRDGDVVWVQANADPIFEPDTNKLSEVIVTFMDISEHVRAERERQSLEDQFRQAQKMDALGHLCGGVAHDFNNLITVIKGHVGLVETTGPLPTPLAESLNQIAEAADRAANLTRQLLAFSRKEVMSARTVNFVAGVKAMAKMLRRMVGENYSLTLTLPEQPVLVYADPGMLDQVLLNLVVNARDAMPKGGEIKIEVLSCSFSQESSGGHPSRRAGEFVALRVKDHGTGIDPQFLPRIFDPFFTTKPQGRGTGLGLATVFGIVRQHQGWIEVEPGWGQGAEFHVFLPKATAGEDAESHELSQAPGGSETILLVEDEPEVRIVLESVLLRRGYHVISVRTAVEALAHLHDGGQPVDLMITDIVLTDATTGPDLYRAALAIRPDLRVVFISGYAPDHITRDMKLQEGVNFLPKPFKPEALLRCVRNRLEIRGSVSPFAFAAG